ncbi:MAG: AAA family ATPase [Muribaculaceae bacterium]|nr:AAA family ATPase [Muribaculaceae bacterium]
MSKLTEKDKQLFEQLRAKRLNQSEVLNDFSMKGLARGTSDIYPDPAHFVYELLQNADDAEATEATFYLRGNELIFKHNGRQFTITDEPKGNVAPNPYGDINAITAYHSTKENETNKIGKFGLGFKSVYIYTKRPEIYDDRFWFAIENRMVPILLEEDCPLRQPGETLFVLPFFDKSISVKEISNKLKSLKSPTLFLNHLEIVQYIDEIANAEYTFEKHIEQSNSIDDIKLDIIHIKDIDIKEIVFLFRRDIEISKKQKHEIAVGYYLTEKWIINTKTKRDIYCFFPTKESFNLCFISHAPFLLTNNRQNINEDPINVKLVEEISELAADALVLLRDYRKEKPLINENIYKIVPCEVPYELDDWGELTSHSHFLDAFKELAEKEPLLYTVSKGFSLSTEACFFGTSKLKPILNTQQLRQLKGQDSLELLQIKDNDDIRYFLEQHLEIEPFNPCDIAENITPVFMGKQEPEWVLRFYKYLFHDARNLWNKRDQGGMASLPFRYAPIFLTQNNEWVAAYKKEGNTELPNLFLPFNDVSFNYNFINKIYYDIDENDVKSFYTQLGIKRPDVVDFVREQILEKYRGESISIDNDVLINDLLSIIDIFNDSQYKGQLEEIEQTLFKDYHIVGIDGYLHHVNEVYLINDNLKEFFKNNDKATFVDYDFYLDNNKGISKGDIENLFLRLGVNEIPRIIENVYQTNSLSDNLSTKQIGKSYYSTKGYNVWDYEIDGLECLLNNNVTIKNSLFLWEFLCNRNISNYIRGKYEYHYYYWYSVSFESTLFELLTNNKWLFNKSGELCYPKNVSQEDLLFQGYKKDDELFKLFDIKCDEKSILELGGSETQQRQQELGAYLERKGISTAEDVDEFIKWKQEQAEKAQIEASRQPSSKPGATEHEVSRDPLHSNQRKTNLDEMSSSSSQYPDRTPRVERSQDERVSDITQKLADEANRRIEEENKRAQVEDLEKYSKVWFTTLLELEYNSSEPTGNRNGIKITFERFKKEVGSDRIYQLTNPSRNIPIWIEDLGGFAVTFTFFNRDDITFDFEVANVKDFTLRVKAKASDVENIDKIDWTRCTKAAIDVNSPVEIMHKLKNEFENLPYESDFNFRDGLTDNLSFVFGPPGTGKTTRLAEIIRHKMELDNCRILVLAPTNKACDVLTRKLIETSIDGHDWLGRFVATGEEFIENNGALIDRASELYEQNKCCIVSTIARLPYDGFTQSPNKMSLRDIEWDFIIVDEASMIPLAQIVYAIYKLNTKVIIAGDPLQIAPIVKEDAWVGENIYTMVNLDNFENPTTSPIQFNVEKLGTQYRSLPLIGTLYSEYCYEGKLRHKRTSADSRNLPTGNIKAKQVNFIPFRVERYDSIYGAKKLQDSNVHVYSAIFSVEMCAYLAKQQIAEKVRIGVICPYAPQAQLINKMIEQRTDVPVNVEILVGTIHGFQGDQCDIILAVFNPPRGIKAAADRIMLNNKNILNVAISRASDYLFVLLPHPDSYGYENLIEINKLCGIANRKCQPVGLFNSEVIEKAIFGNKDFIEQNTFVTTHQVANVYTSVSGLYEIRIDENAVDIQTSGENYQPKNMMTTTVTNQVGFANVDASASFSESQRHEPARPLTSNLEFVENKTFLSEEQYYKYFKEHKLDVDSALKLLFEENTICAMFTVLQIFGIHEKTQFFGKTKFSESDVKIWRDYAYGTDLGKFIYPLIFFAVRGHKIPIKGIAKKISEISYQEFSEAISDALRRWKYKKPNNTQEKKRRPRIGEKKKKT